MRVTTKSCWMVLALVALTGLAAAQDRTTAPALQRKAWDPETVRLFATLPVQDGGRIKPIDTLAGFQLLELNGKRSLTTPDGEQLESSEWLLDCLFFPELAKTYACFLVQNRAVLTAVGIEGKARRDRYTYLELLPGRAALLKQAELAGAVPSEARDLIQRQTVQLATDLLEFERLVGFLDFLHTGVTSEAAVLAILPPAEREEERWLDPTTLSSSVTPEQHEVLAILGRMQASSAERETFRAELANLNAVLRGMAEARGEYGKIPMEVSYYRMDYFTRGLVAFLLGLLLVSASLLAPRMHWVRWLRRGTWAAVSIGTVLVVAGITLRCIIRSRPPVSTLYETILFTTACCVVVCLAIEWMNRQRVALALSTVLGAGGMFLAMKYELREVALAGDTMPSLVAVLDANFWLATHVTTITIGYAGGLLAAAIAHVWILGKLLGYRPEDAAFYRTVSRMTYGVLCFGLLFTVLGTLLGGIWANYSWGRFWGWDPKENAALMICLWEIAMLQARLGGYIRDHGLALSSVILGGVVLFSWWGVNLLGTGLHSYGDIPGVLPTLRIYATVESGVLVVWGVKWLLTRKILDAGGIRMGSAAS